jgi:hypothetical protein
VSPSALSSIRRLTALFGRASAGPAKPLVERKLPAAMIGRGFSDPRQKAGLKRIVVTVDEATFERVRAQALDARISVAAMVRRLIGRALDNATNGTGGCQ